MTSTVGKVYMLPGDVNERLEDGGSYLHKVISGDKESGWVTALLEHGANPNTLTNSGISPLLLAAAKNRADVVTALLDHGADANTHKYKGYTALRTAAAGGFTEIVRILVQRGADATIRDTEEGLTPLAIARKNGHAAVVELLEEREDLTVEPRPSSPPKASATAASITKSTPTEGRKRWWQLW